MAAHWLLFLCALVFASADIGNEPKSKCLLQHSAKVKHDASSLGRRRRRRRRKSSDSDDSDDSKVWQQVDNSYYDPSKTALTGKCNRFYDTNSSVTLEECKNHCMYNGAGQCGAICWSAEGDAVGRNCYIGHSAYNDLVVGGFADWQLWAWTEVP
eukprot:TRINITY_DN59270_c0_g1_i1.p1 TRINITY_DN59270_c0_g1~~TRINITY_DN59270_c0_g1_i1.p1  ORF type:complete len:155 (-),score=23.47 TRINITY_DN59270_c0_g1_i1:79-543(-)